MKKLGINHNLEDWEFEEVLEKALESVKSSYMEPNRQYPDNLANQIKDDANANFDKIVRNMLDEIHQVITKQK